jgi:hypothetical protein
MKISQKYSNLLFAFIMSVLMATLMTFIVTIKLTGLNADFTLRWLHAFLTAWPIAFPAILLLAPVTRKLVAKLTE